MVKTIFLVKKKSKFDQMFLPQLSSPKLVNKKYITG